MVSKQITIALTGSSGHIAAAAIPLLIAKGCRIRALIYQQDPGFNSSDVDIVKGSLSDRDSLNQLVKGCEVVIHLAGKISLNSDKDRSVYETNLNGTRNIFEAAREAGAKRFIQVSSIHAYDQKTSDEALDEESPFCADSAPAYDRSKRDSQLYVLHQASDQMEVVVVNPTAVIGPFDQKPSHLGKAIMEIYNREIPVLIRGGFDFVDVRDVAQGIVRAIEKGRNGHAYLLSGNWYSLDDLQRIIMTIRGDTRRIPVLPAWTGYLGLPFIRLFAALSSRDPLYTRESIMALTLGNKKISSRKASEELGYSCRPLNETIADTISWFKQAGYLT